LSNESTFFVASQRAHYNLLSQETGNTASHVSTDHTPDQAIPFSEDGGDITHSIVYAVGSTSPQEFGNLSIDFLIPHSFFVSDDDVLGSELNVVRQPQPDLAISIDRFKRKGKKRRFISSDGKRE